MCITRCGLLKILLESTHNVSTKHTIVSCRNDTLWINTSGDALQVLVSGLQPYTYYVIKVRNTEADVGKRVGVLQGQEEHFWLGVPPPSPKSLVPSLHDANKSVTLIPLYVSTPPRSFLSFFLRFPVCCFFFSKFFCLSNLITHFFLFVVQPILDANSILIVNNSFLCNCNRLQFAPHMAVQWVTPEQQLRILQVNFYFLCLFLF